MLAVEILPIARHHRADIVTARSRRRNWDLGVLGSKNERPKRTPLLRQTLVYLRKAYESRVNGELFFPVAASGNR
jgi:hypothetical protein